MIGNSRGLRRGSSWQWPLQWVTPSPPSTASHARLQAVLTVTHSHARALRSLSNAPRVCRLVLMILHSFRFQNRSISYASFFQVSGPYRPLSGNWNVTSITWPQDMGCTDPFLWRDPSGHFHAVFHCRDWNTGGPSAGDAGGHAYSADGMSWGVAQEPAWTLTVDHTDGTNTTFFHRERPQVKKFMPMRGVPFWALVFV